MIWTVFSGERCGPWASCWTAEIWIWLSAVFPLSIFERPLRKGYTRFNHLRYIHVNHYLKTWYRRCTLQIWENSWNVHVEFKAYLIFFSWVRIKPKSSLNGWLRIAREWFLMDIMRIIHIKSVSHHISTQVWLQLSTASCCVLLITGNDMIHWLL